MKFKELLRLTGLPVVFASLCCLTPVILVFLGLSSVSFAASLSDTLYGSYNWVFRSVGLAFLIPSIFMYLRRKRGICNLHDAKKRKYEVINVIAIALITATIGYIFFLYVVVNYAGIWLNIWQ